MHFVYARSYGFRSFNMFGFDMMVDAALKVWLIEVNSSPAVTEALLPRVARDLIRTAVDPVWPPLRALERRGGAAPRASAFPGGLGRPVGGGGGGGGAGGGGGGGAMDDSEFGDAEVDCMSIGRAAAAVGALSEEQAKLYARPCGGVCCQWGFERIDDAGVDWRTPFI